MRIEFLFWDECPSHDEALARLREALAEQQVTAPVQVIEVTSDHQARTLRFPGSPTIRIDGADLFPEPAGPYALTCRIYFAEDGRVTPLPTPAMMRRAVRSVLNRTEE